MVSFLILNAKSKLLIVVAISIMNMMIITFIPLNHVEAQNPANIEPKDVNRFTPLFCDQDAIDNKITGSGTTFNFSSDEVVPDIRCHLREARNAIAAGASDSALLQISEAGETLLVSRNSLNESIP
jgi:hypothetical protein